MIKASELRIGNLVTWNPQLVSPNSTLPPIQVEVSAILPDRIHFVYPNIENRVEPFEDDIAQTGSRYKLFTEIEPIALTEEILQAAGFEKKGGVLSTTHYNKAGLQLQKKEAYFEPVSASGHHTQFAPLAVKYFHQLQNLYFAYTGEELEIKLHGQQS